MANPLDFLQLTPENIAQAKGMSWGQALKTEIPGSSTYRGFNPAYKGAGATGLGGYIKSGLQSLTGNVPASGGVGGATPLTRKLALSAMDYAPKALGIASRFLGPASFLFNATPANADEINMTAEDFQNLALQNQTQPIDPTGKNLFTQYYEDDPYAGIEGQTAFFNPLSLLTFGSKMLGPAHAYKTGGINELMKYKIRKEISKDVAKKGKKAAQKILEAKAAAKAKAEAEARKKQQQKTIAAKGTAQGSGGTFVHSSGAMKGYEKGAGGGKDAPSEHFYIARGGLAQRAPRYANGGLINFYRYGGFI